MLTTLAQLDAAMARNPPAFQSKRLSDLLSPLSNALDLAEGQPLGHAIRSCILGMRIAQSFGVPLDLQQHLYYALLLKDAGATSVASQRPHRGITGPQRSQVLAGIRGESGAAFARKIGLHDMTALAIRNVQEDWRDPQVSILARIVNIAQFLDTMRATRGPKAALKATLSASGRIFDPSLVKTAVMLAKAGCLWTDLDGEPACSLVPTLEPGPHRLINTPADLDLLCVAFSGLIDAKSPFSMGHSTRVADVAARIAHVMDLPLHDLALLRRAALLHGVGSLCIPNSVLENPGPLTGSEWKVVRRHPFYTQQILQRIADFREVAEIASAHQERLDGSGYFRGLTAETLSLPARILAVASVYVALTSLRPYRDPVPFENVFSIMRGMTPHQLDLDCLDALQIANAF